MTLLCPHMQRWHLSLGHLDILLQKCLSRLTPNTNASVGSKKPKAAFVRKDDASPLPQSPMHSLHGPTFSAGNVNRRQPRHFAHSPAPDCSFSDSASHHLRAENIATTASLSPKKAKQCRRQCAVGPDDSDEQSVRSCSRVPSIAACKPANLITPRFQLLGLSGVEIGWYCVISQTGAQLPDKKSPLPTCQ